ncbi:hypothetical protein [Costertonia aggregata]|uniref:DUF3379 domain-containing protein n=1 Tax=Costertonia aggregata TaxID=343403 RepID=A0A7H9AK90_9FLAO|nr:hypothetical protein [Costertonia aggregata]QLG43916.1 hypothetical protein HYG79_00645 [Costertonia aggregata]
MELDNIEKLLEKYFESTTTVAEEKTLRDYFSQENVATHLRQYAPMFNYFSKAKEETFTRQVPLRPRRSNFYKWGSVAAVAVLAIGIYFGKEYQDEKQLEREKAEYAYNETKKALNLLAENFGRGTEKVAYLKEFEETKQKIYKHN